nr:immunoglobulin heavy chain junction region [Mus musculus]
ARGAYYSRFAYWG